MSGSGATVAAPPKSPRQDELEALIREARARRRRRWMIGAAAVAVLAGAALGINSIVSGGSPTVAPSGGGPSAAVKSGKACGVRVSDMRIVDSSGRTLYREPGDWTRNYPHPSVVRCSGATVWVVWDNGAAMNQEGYVGARSGDGGDTWRLVFAEPFFGVKAPHALGSYLGPWTLRGTRAAYFTGWCPVCGRKAPFGSTSLSVTKDGGRTFREYQVTALTGYQPIGIRVSERHVTITARGFFSGTWRRKTVTVHTA